MFGVKAQIDEAARYAHAAFDKAVDLVEKQMGEGLVSGVNLQVSNSRQMAELIVEAHRPMFGRQSASEWRRHASDPFGAATVAVDGVLIVIDAQRCRGRDKEIAKTLLHEIGHAVQLGRPEVRDRCMRGLRNNYGIDPLTQEQVDELDAFIDDEEAEAADLERLWRKLHRCMR